MTEQTLKKVTEKDIEQKEGENIEQSDRKRH